MSPSLSPERRFPSSSGTTALLVMLAALCFVAFGLTVVATTAVPFTTGWPGAWLAALLGVMLTLLIAVAVVWYERRQLALWYHGALMAFMDDRQGQSSLNAPPAETLPATQVVEVLASLTQVANSFTVALEHQQQVITALSQARPQAQPSQAQRSAAPAGPRDLITGAITQATLMRRLVPDVEMAREHQRTLALAIFDIDNFHIINNRLGYGMGDEVLLSVARRIQSQLGEGDLLARLEGDRFAVVWPGMAYPQAQSAVERILGVVARDPLTVQSTDGQQGTTVRVSLRAGLAICPDDGLSAQALIEIANDALDGTPAKQGRYAQSPSPLSEDVAHTSSPATEDVQAAWPMGYIDAMSNKHSSIQALTMALEAHDSEAVSHARTLADLAQETAMILGRSVEEARLVGLAALLHDVGNLGIPAEILTKAEPLSDEEWAFVREHPHLGERLLNSVGGVLGAVAPIVASHRERWDGTGYPEKLSGESIPLGARIVAVCDVYGALISSRPYREAFTKEDAVAEMKRMTGTQFDPNVVAAFITALDH